MTEDSLVRLEYQVRRSLTVREEQEEDAEPAHIASARDCGLAVGDSISKGDLLARVQSELRSIRRRTGAG